MRNYTQKVIKISLTKNLWHLKYNAKLLNRWRGRKDGFKIRKNRYR